MKEREHDREGEPESPPRSGDGPGCPSDESRRRAAELLAAGDEAIRKALSSDSYAFHRSNRQRSGE